MSTCLFGIGGREGEINITKHRHSVGIHFRNHASILDCSNQQVWISTGSITSDCNAKATRKHSSPTRLQHGMQAQTTNSRYLANNARHGHVCLLNVKDHKEGQDQDQALKTISVRSTMSMEARDFTHFAPEPLIPTPATSTIRVVAFIQQCSFEWASDPMAPLHSIPFHRTFYFNLCCMLSCILY